MDKEIVDRMRNENPEQFQTLVRMHLSFELDLNTDPVEWVFNEINLLLFCTVNFCTMLTCVFHNVLAIYIYVYIHNIRCSFCYSNDSVANVKLRSKKLFAFPKKSKQLHSTSKSPPFNVVDALTPVGIEQIKQMIRFLMESQSEC